MSISDSVNHVVTVLDQPLTRGHKKKARTRRALLAAAIDVIAERGEGFSIGDITERAGVSNGTFYNYFEDREALLAAVVPQVLTAYAEQSASLVDDADPVLRFATISALTLRRAAAAPDHLRVLFRLDVVHRVVLDDTVFAHLRADVEAGVEAGRFEGPVDEATLHVIVGAELLAARRAAEQGDDPAYAARVVAQLLRTLGLAPVDATAVAHRAIADADALAA